MKKVERGVMMDLERKQNFYYTFTTETVSKVVMRCTHEGVTLETCGETEKEARKNFLKLMRYYMYWVYLPQREQKRREREQRRTT